MASLAVLAVSVTLARGETDPLAALVARTDAVTKEVSALRGLRVKQQIDREIVDRHELRARLLALADDPQTTAETRAEGLALARWGLVPRSTDYLRLMVDLMTDQVAGYYDPKTKKLTISRQAADDPAWAELVLAHEIVHGLQDQTFDLAKFRDVPMTEGDEALARRALAEGDGIALMIELALARQGVPEPWPNVAIGRDLERAMALPRGDLLDRAPLAVRERMLFPYRAGLAFVAALRRNDPWSAVDRAFRRPPRSTEQILHHDKYVAGEAPVAISLAAPSALAGYAVVHSTVWGELGFSLFLRAHGIPDETAAQAAAGWGGDRVLTLARTAETGPGHGIGVARMAWDSEADAIEAHEAAVRALDRGLVGATAEHGADLTRWLALDGTVAVIERRGSELAIAVGVPVQSWAAVAAELWAAAATQANR